MRFVRRMLMHVWLMQNLLYFSVIVLGLTRCVSLGRRERRQRSGRNVRKYENDFTVL